MSYAIKHSNKNARAQDSLQLELKEFDEADRSFTAIASVESPDRAGDVISVKGWKLENYRKNPVLLSHHDLYSPPVGKAVRTPWVSGKQLLFRPKFSSTNPQADLLFGLFKEKMLKGFSVGFLPIRFEKIKDKKGSSDRMSFHDPIFYKEQELLEISVVAIPAHQDALAEIRGFVRRGMLAVPEQYLNEDVFTLDDEEVVELEDEQIEIGVSDGEFKKMVKVAVDSALGRLQDDDESVIGGRSLL